MISDFSLLCDIASAVVTAGYLAILTFEQSRATRARQDEIDLHSVNQRYKLSLSGQAVFRRAWYRRQQTVAA